MKIALTVATDSEGGVVDARFGRAFGFMMYDTESGEYSFTQNSQNLHAAQGAGIQAAQNVINAGVEAVITGHCGPKAFRVLNEACVPVVLGMQGVDIKEAVAKYEAGELGAAASADVEGHWV